MPAVASLEASTFSHGLLKSVLIPSRAESLGPGCFANHHGLLRVTFIRPSRLKIIGTGAFSCCKALRSICIPASVGEILYSLSSICSPSTVRLLEKYCFYDCSNLSSVTFDSLSHDQQFDGFGFAGCKLLNALCLPASLAILSGLESLNSLKFEAGSAL
jgi:hypothetical protein